MPRHRRRTVTVTLTAVAAIALAASLRAQPTAGELATATELLEVTDIEGQMVAGITTMVDLQIQGDPTLGPFREVLVEWAESVVARDAVVPRLAELYAGVFTVTEMEEMIAFHRTPTGRKMLAEMPALMQQSAAIGVELAGAHQGRLEEMLRARSRELEAAAAPPTGADAGDRFAGAEDRAAAKATLERLRSAGLAMTAWRRDNADDTAGAGTGSEPSSDGDLRLFDWSRCPPITHERLSALVVPLYIRDLPATDGWGHALEFCLAPVEQRSEVYAVGVRSAGRDGRFADGEHPRAPFPPADVDRDAVWLDGLFVAWPESGARD